MRFASLFAGAGGLDLGLEYAGWECIFATDVNQLAVSTLQANQFKRTGGIRALADAHIEQADIRDLNGADILAKAGLRRGDVPLVAGGPPCQSWSSAGHQLGFEDPRGRLFEDYVRVAKQLDARWLLFENVRGLVTARGSDGVPGSALALIRSELSKAGWQTTVRLLNSADYGVAQRRVRLFLVGHHAGDEPAFPMPTHSETGDFLSKKWISAQECLSKIRPVSEDEVVRPSSKLAEELKGLKPGTGAKSAGKAETTRPGGHWGYKQGAFISDLELPARTVTANAQQDWVLDATHGLRKLTPRECAALQSFPACWRFVGGKADQYKQIGNAVPPLLAKALGEALLNCAANSRTSSKSRVAVVPSRLPVQLEAAIAYTQREEHRNGASRRAVSRRKPLRRYA